MLAGEVIEIIGQDLNGILHGRSLLAQFDLKKKAFAKITGSHSGRLKLLDHLKHLQHFFFRCLHIGPERKIIHYTFYASAQIAVIIKASDKERCHSILMFCQISITELLLKTLRKAFLHGKCAVLRTLVLRIIVSPQPVARNRIVILIFRQRYFSWSLILFLVTGNILIQNRILFQFLSDPLLQLLHRQLDELDCLNLQRRKFLLLLQFQSLLQHNTTTFIQISQVYITTDIHLIHYRPQNLHGISHHSIISIHHRILDSLLDHKGTWEIPLDTGKKSHSLRLCPEIPHCDLEIWICIYTVSCHIREKSVKLLQSIL